jgi:hypothetical protein
MTTSDGCCYRLAGDVRSVYLKVIRLRFEPGGKLGKDPGDASEHG